MKERISRLLKAIEAEREQEEEFFRNLAKTKSIKEKIEAGITWFPVSIDKIHYTIAEKIELEVTPSKLNSASERNSFKVGMSAVLFSINEEKEEFKGTISFANKKRIRMILNSNRLDEHSLSNLYQCGIELIYDDRPYRVMRQALYAVDKSKEIHIQDLKRAIAQNHYQQHNRSDSLPGLSNNLLNSSQKEAIARCFNVERIGLIHGPPGTGKTTTLISLIEQIVLGKERLLVCAPSNNAVDLLAKGISDVGIEVLRIGNVSRIGDSIAHLCLEEKVRSHRDWQHIKQVRIEAEHAKREAARYKRKYGPKQKRERSALMKEGRELFKWAKELENKLSEQVLQNSKVVCATLIGCAHPLLSEISFDTIIIDEASQALEPESWTAMLKGRRVIMAGDHMQLPPTVKSSKAQKLGLDQTLLDILMPKLAQRYLLEVQYRMNERILAFSNQNFYNNSLLSAEFVKDRCLKRDHEILTFIDTSGCGFEEEKGRLEKSYSNQGEYLLIREHLLSLKEVIDQTLSIGIISPYAKQVSVIRQEVAEDEYLRLLNLEVNSIDGFQGQEKDVVYISFVRSNDHGKIGFLKDYRRLNVALTRARMKLTLVGDMSTLGHDEMFLRLANHIENFGTYKSGWDYML